MTPGSVAPRTVHSVRPFPQLQPDQPVEMYFSLTTFQYGPMQLPAVQPISTLILSTIPSGSPGSLSLSLSAKTTKFSPVTLQALSLLPKSPTCKSKLKLFHALQLQQNPMQLSC